MPCPSLLNPLKLMPILPRTPLSVLPLTLILIFPVTDVLPLTGIIVLPPCYASFCLASSYSDVGLV